jgi:hypothetical protein
LKKGAAKFLYCVSVGVVPSGNSITLKPCFIVGSKFLDFLGQRHEFFCGLCTGTAIAGDCTRKGLLPISTEVMKTKIIQSCQEDNVGVGTWLQMARNAWLLIAASFSGL